MKISSVCDDGKLTIFLSGELDHHGARNSIPKISELIDYDLPAKITLDFGGITFMDSSGIALVIASFKRARSLGSEFLVINTSKQAYKVFNAAGICRIVNIFTSETAATK